LREFAIDKKQSQFCVSANGSWLGVADDEGKLHVFEIATGRLVRSSVEKIDSLTRLAVSDDGRWVYMTEFTASLKRWDTQNDRFEKLNAIRGQCRELRLSADQSRILVGGNHRDVSIYDAKTGESIASFETEAADFNVTNIWASGDRLIFTTDSGVMFDGRLESSRRDGK
jgi:WD40 repeat protein